MSIRKLFVLLALLPLMRVCAQQVSFRSFLAMHEKNTCIDSMAFGKPLEFIENAEQYASFLPVEDNECHCTPGDLLWAKGSYMEQKDFTIVMLLRFCVDYQDGNDKYFMENDGLDYILITYSRDGKILDHKVVAHEGRPYKIRMKTARNGLGLVVEQKVLEDCNLLYQYKNLVYQVCKNEYVVRQDGKIEVHTLETPHSEVVDVMSSVKLFSFEEFLSHFEKWDKPFVDHTIFDSSMKRNELPFESCRSLLPDTLDHSSWPRDLYWTTGKYIETKKHFLCFLAKECRRPDIGCPYVDYLVLEFDKKGRFRRAVNIYRYTDDDYVDEATQNSMMTSALKTCIGYSQL